MTSVSAKTPTGKPQDGWVSRCVNRPVSRAITRLLLPFSITPNQWTLAIIPLPIGAAILLAHGGYLVGLVGTFLYQFYSILDGCDGEIARAKNLHSQFGERLDKWCDTVASALVCVGAGFGLSEVTRPFYLVEGVTGSLLIVLNELWLERTANTRASAQVSDSAVYARHRDLLAYPALGMLGPRLMAVLIQVTKRDVGILFFVFLAAINQVGLMVHLLFLTALVTSGLAAAAASRRRHTIR